MRNDNALESLWIVAIVVSVIVTVLAIVTPTPYDKEPDVKLEKEVRAENMNKICFPDHVYVESAHKYCKKYKEDLMADMTFRERQMAEKCLRDNVNINKCVRVK